MSISATQQEWLTRSQVAELTGLRVVTVTSYACKEKWRRKEGPNKSVLFWHEDALRQRRPYLTTNSLLTIQRLEGRVVYKACSGVIPELCAPLDNSSKVIKAEILEPVLCPTADTSRTPGAVRHFILSKS